MNYKLALAIAVTLALSACTVPIQSAGVLLQCKSGEIVMTDGHGNNYVVYPDKSQLPLSSGTNIAAACKVL